jgi:hypothetical protein
MNGEVGEQFAIVYNRYGEIVEIEKVPEMLNGSNPAKVLFNALHDYFDTYVDNDGSLGEDLFDISTEFVDNQLVNMMTQKPYLPLVMLKLKELRIMPDVDDSIADELYEDEDEEDEYENIDTILTTLADRVTNLVWARMAHLREVQKNM